MQIRAIQGSLEREQAYALRRAVFVDEQGIPESLELDALDPEAEHFLVWEGSLPIGTGRLVIEAAGYAGLAPDLGAVGHVGRLAVLAEHRGRGVGRTLVRVLEQLVIERELQVIYLAAQDYAVDFYRSLGYEPYGEPFVEAGITHRHLAKQVALAAPIQ